VALDILITLCHKKNAPPERANRWSCCNHWKSTNRAQIHKIKAMVFNFYFIFIQKNRFLNTIKLWYSTLFI
jgi:hypothetical protein